MGVGEPQLRVEAVAKQFGGVAAVEDVSLDVKRYRRRKRWLS